MGGIKYPLLSDFWPHGEVAQRYGVLRKEGFTERAVFVIDKEGTVRYVDIHNIAEAPDPKDALDALDRITVRT
jgi:peroxiredoxin